MATLLPDFIIVGGQKCGTTAAARNLALHPQIRVFRGTTRAGQKNEIEFFNQHWDKGVAWYASHFEPTDGIQGEKTAELLHRTICHERMAQINPHVKIVILLRSPIERAYSQWRMASLHKGDEPEHFDAVVARELKLLDAPAYREGFYACRDTGVSCWREGYLLKGMYAEQIESIYRHFQNRQVIIAITEQVRKDMSAGYAPMFEFLGVPPIAAAFSDHFVGREGPPMSVRTRSLLTDLYREPNERLFSLLGERVPEWS